MKIYYGRLLAAPPVGTAQEAFDLLCRLLDEVEDEHSGKPKDPDPPLKYDGRMYPPQSDMTAHLPDGSIRARSARNWVYAYVDGTILITDLDGAVILKKPGKASPA